MQFLAFLFALLSVTNISLVVRAQDVDPGQSEYLAHCASCHGIDGRGSKPIGGQQPKPADLTLLAKRSGGVFLSSAVFEMIDGRRAIRSYHNSMPIWGCRYASEPFCSSPLPALAGEGGSSNCLHGTYGEIQAAVWGPAGIYYRNRSSMTPASVRPLGGRANIGVDEKIVGDLSNIRLCDRLQDLWRARRLVRRHPDAVM